MYNWMSSVSLSQSSFLLYCLNARMCVCVCFHFALASCFSSQSMSIWCDMFGQCAQIENHYYWRNGRSERLPSSNSNNINIHHRLRLQRLVHTNFFALFSGTFHIENYVCSSTYGYHAHDINLTKGRSRERCQYVVLVCVCVRDGSQ